jgi:hypothetical protein
MNKQESVRDAGMCLGGFLGLFLGGMLGFAVCTQIVYEKIARNDGSQHPNQALLPFLGVMAGACVGAVVGVVVMRLAFAVYSFAFGEPADKSRPPAKDNGLSN